MNIENLDGIQKNELIKQLLTIIEYMETTFHIRSIHQLLNETANFLVQTLKISNTTITIDETTARYYTNQQIPQTYSDVENKLIKELQDLKTNIKIIRKRLIFKLEEDNK